jgi:ABC-type transport system involved in Fe-S cluster assembly fused permease/ATPase subunit
MVAIMNERMKKRAALYMLIRFVDENNGNITINTDKVKRVFNDENDIVRIEYVSGEVGLLADADFDTMNNAILKWQSMVKVPTCHFIQS